MDLNRIVKSNFDNDGPIYPGRILASHVGLRGLQVGAGLGLLIGTPLIKHLKKVTVVEAWMKAMPFYSICGAGVVLGYTFYKHLDDIEGVDTRARKLLHNQDQTRLDKYLMSGAVVGGTIGALAGRNVRAILTTSFTGLAVGNFVYFADKQYAKSKVL